MSLSFFDTDHEIIKVSNCDQAGNAKPRVHSLATHALLSTEIFVVLDTHLVCLCLCNHRHVFNILTSHRTGDSLTILKYCARHMSDHSLGSQFSQKMAGPWQSFRFGATSLRCL